MAEDLITIETLSERLDSLTDTVELIHGRFSELREIVRRDVHLGAFVAIPEEDIDALFPQGGKAKDAFLEELGAYNKRRAME